jgi:hypothetical protein
MSANFLLANNPCWIDGTAGSAAAVGTGAFTIVALVHPTIGNNSTGILDGRAAGATQRALLEAGLHLFGVGDFSSGDATTLVQGNWYVAAQSKSAAAAPYRHHLWLYDPSGAGVMAHGVSTGSANQGNGAALDTLRVGNALVPGNCDIAIIGLWAGELTDPQLNTLKSASLVSWASLAPAELITYENWNGATGWSTRLGTSAQSVINGTVGVGANPPDFDFNLAITVDLVPSVFTFSAVPVVPTVPSVGGPDIEWCTDLAPNWSAEPDLNWDAALAPNWSAELVEECS